MKIEKNPQFSYNLYINRGEFENPPFYRQPRKK